MKDTPDHWMSWSEYWAGARGLAVLLVPTTLLAVYAPWAWVVVGSLSAFGVVVSVMWVLADGIETDTPTEETDTP